jgi:hypothetical protein
MEATGTSFEKCVVNFNLQLVMFLNHTVERTGFASQSRYTQNFERSEREDEAFEFQKWHWFRFVFHRAIVSCAADCTLVQNVLPSETENAEVSNK